jgi:hypothetical protein
VGRVLCADNFSIVPRDECWIPVRTDPVKLSIVPIGGIHIFIGEAVNFDGSALVSSARTAIEPDTFAEIRSEQDPPMAGIALDQEFPAWTAFEHDTSAEEEFEQ